MSIEKKKLVRSKTGCMTCRVRRTKCNETRPGCDNCARNSFICNWNVSQWGRPKKERKPIETLVGSNGEAQVEYPHQQQYLDGQPSTTSAGIRDDGESTLTFSSGFITSGIPATSAGITDDGPSASTFSGFITSRIPATSAGIRDDGANASTFSSGFITSGIPATSAGIRDDGPSASTFCGFITSKIPTTSQLPISPFRQAAKTSSTVVGTISESNYGRSLPLDELQEEQHTKSLSDPVSASPRTHKEEMLIGRPYFPFDRELVLDRQRCSNACWRFNNTLDPGSGISKEERTRLFRNILQPKDVITSSAPISSVSPSGHASANVEVQAPFSCDYGYNIHIGQDVLICKNCKILDACEVSIGDRCVISPNVSIYTETVSTDPVTRAGCRGLHQAKPIVIEEDCWIGGGVTILAGLTIQKGSTVGAGSIVTKDVPPYTIAYGNPAQSIRGIWHEDSQKQSVAHALSAATLDVSEEAEQW